MVKAVIFDLDNTLIDFLSFKQETAKAVAIELRRHGWKLSEMETYDKIFAIYQEKGIEYQKTFADLIYGEGYGGNEAEKLQQAAIIAYNRHKYHILKPYFGVMDMLEGLRKKGLKLAVLTDAPRNKAWQRLVLAGLENYFDEVGTYQDTQVHKPDKTPFLRICEKLGVDASDCLFVGDNPSRDIKGAKEVGMRTAWAKYGHVGQYIGYCEPNKEDEKLADFVLERPKDILKVEESGK